MIWVLILSLFVPSWAYAESGGGLRQWTNPIPLDAGDSRILLDATLTSSAAATNAGFTLAGTGHEFDEFGFNGNGTGYLLMSNWASASSMTPQGSVYLEFDRTALSWSYLNNGASTFSASEGIDGGAVRYLFRAYNDAFTEEIRVFIENGSDDLARIMYETTAQSTTTTLGRMNSHAITDLDSRTMTLVITWSGLDYWVYWDGHLIMHKTNTATPHALRFDNMRLMDSMGDTYIKRIQLSTAFMLPRMHNRKVAAFGDSFILASIQGASAGADTVAGIDAIQTHTGLPERLVNYAKGRGQGSWGHWLQAIAQHEWRVNFPFYVSAKNGAGYSLTPIPSAYADAVNAFAPEVIIAMQSVNDVNPAAPVADIVADTTAILDTMIDGDPALRQILFVTGISGHQDPTKVAISGWMDEYRRLSALLNAGLDGYRGKVTVIDAWSDWGGAGYDSTQTVGSHPLNTTSSAGNDVHPTEIGHIRIAEILWPYLSPYLLNRYPRQ